MTPRLPRARGFTLVELLVAMTIGLLLTILVAQVFLSSKRAYASTDDLSRMQESMRFAYDILGRTIRMSEYTSSPASYHFSYDGYTGIFDAGNTALDGTDGATAAASDSLIVRYQGTPDGFTVDCLGNPVATGVIATSIFTVETVNNVPSLVCRANASDPPIVLVGDVENMQVLYGEDTNGDVTTDRYVPKSLVSRPELVMSVRVALLFRTTNTGMRASPDATQYNLLGTTLPAFTGLEATRVRRVMTTTFSLRNRTT